MEKIDPHAHLRAAFTAGCRIQAWHLNDGAANSNDGRWDTLTPPEGREPEFGCEAHLYRVHPEDLSLIAELGQEVGAVAWTKDAEGYGNALNEAAWKFVEECPEKSALLFNNTKKPLRAAILTYAEHVARATYPAHTSEARDALLIAGGKLRAAMEMQEGRELETLHISQPTAKFLWDSAKAAWDDAAMRQEGGND